MKVGIILLLIVLAPTIGWANGTSDADSLYVEQNYWQKIDICYDEKEYSSAKFYANQAIQYLNEKEGTDSCLYVEALIKKVPCSIAVQEFSEARRILSQANQLLNTLSTTNVKLESGILWYEGLIHLRLNEFDKAKQVYHNLITSPYSIPPSRIIGAYINLRHIAEQQDSASLVGEYSKKALNKVHQYYPKYTTHHADVYTNRYIYLYYAGEGEKALLYADSTEFALQHVYANEPLRDDFLELYGHKIVLYRAIGDFKGATEAFLKIIDIQKQKENESPELATAYANYGVWLMEMGDYTKALMYFQKALSIREKVTGINRNEKLIARTYNYIGNAYLQKNDLANAEKYLNEALEKRKNLKIRIDSELADSYQDVGKYQEKIGFWKAALRQYEAALEINQQVYKDQPSIALSENYYRIGNIYLSQGSYKTAIPFFEKAVETIEQIYNVPHPETGNYYRALAVAHIRNPRKSQYYLEKAFEEVGYYELGGLSGINSMITLLKILQTQARLLIEDKESDHYLVQLLEAEEIYNEAFRVIDEIKITYTESGSKQSLLNNYFSIYEDAIRVNYELFEATGQEAYLHRAFQISEGSNSTLLVEAFNTVSAERVAGIPDEELAEERYLKNQITLLEKERFELRTSGGSAAEINELTDQLFDLKNEYDEKVAYFIENYPRYSELKFSNDFASVQKVQQHLISDEELLVEYFLGEDMVYIFVISRDSFEVIPIEKNFPLEAWVEELRLGIYHYYPPDNKNNLKKQKYANIAFELYQTIIQPVAEKYPQRRWNIIPGGILGYLPFEALLSEPIDVPNTPFSEYPYVLKKWTIYQNYSATYWLRLLENERSEAANFVLGVAPDFSGTQGLELRSGNFTQLLFNKQEVYRILNFATGKTLVGESATIENFKKYSPLYRILHLATHGYANDIAGDYSFLAFDQNADPSDNTDILYVKDLYNIDIHAEMVVLSACETADGEWQRGEGIVSLARGFFYAGTQSIITTLWKIDDRASLEMMPEFYKYLEKGYTKADALRQVKLDYITGKDRFHAHPLYWAAFTPVGNMKPIQLHPETIFVQVIWGASFLIIGAFLCFLITRKD